MSQKISKERLIRLFGTASTVMKDYSDCRLWRIPLMYLRLLGHDWSVLLDM